VSAAFDDCAELAPAAREARLAALPPEVARHTRALLGAHDSPHSLPTVGAGLQDAVQAVQAQPGQRIGPYRLLACIGRGGMAEVWGAEQVDGPMQGRRVALKLPFGGRLSERLNDERALLLALEHPHIARLYDAGTEPGPARGQPWLALEWVSGEAIDRALAGQPLRARLITFLQVLDAVRHAHARLILHADLKPGNILVGADGRVKLLDFGIARLLDHDGLHAFSPASAAPEQRRGERLTVATDVYGLGGVLAAIVPEAERRGLAGAATAAVLKRALAPEPGDRYPDVEGFAAEIHRILDHRPVLAWPPTDWRGRVYHGVCLLRRQRLPLMALAALGLGLATALWQADTARREARRAEAASAYLLDLFKTLDRRAVDANQPEAALRRLLSDRMARIDAELPNDPDTAAELLRITATLNDYLGDAQRSRALGQQRYDLLKGRLGRQAPATVAAGLSLIWPLLAAEDHPAAAALLAELDRGLPARGLGRAEWLLAQHDLRQQQGAGAAEREALLRRALARYEADAPADSSHAATWLALSELLAGNQRPAEALTAVDTALALVSHAEPYIASDHARQLLHRAALKQRLGLAGVESDEEAALALLRPSVGLRAPFVRKALHTLIERRCGRDREAAQALAAEAGQPGCTPP
jgi:serine/threonine-protein kinase